jgi:hypothetical protein
MNVCPQQTAWGRNGVGSRRAASRAACTAFNGVDPGKVNPGRNYTRFLFRMVALSSLFRKDDFLRGMMN